MEFARVLNDDKSLIKNRFDRWPDDAMQEQPYSRAVVGLSQRSGRQSQYKCVQK